MNTVSDFLDTAESLEADITCPSCGGSMAAQMQGSYELVLSPRARNEFNNVLSLYRGFLLDLEEQLSTHNLLGVHRAYGLQYPYTGDADFGSPGGSGLFQNPFAAELGGYLGAFDRYERRRLIGELPAVGQPGPAGDAGDAGAVIRNVLLGLEPNLIIGPLANVVLGQRHVAAWIDAMIRDEPPDDGPVGQVLRQVCPTITDYLQQAGRQAGAGSGTDSGLPGSAETAVLVRRAELLLVLLLGHRADNATGLTLGFMRKDDPYRLPAEVQVQSRLLADIAASAVLLRRRSLGLSDSFRKLVSDGRFGQPAGASARPDTGNGRPAAAARAAAAYEPAAAYGRPAGYEQPAASRRPPGYERPASAGGGSATYGSGAADSQRLIAEHGREVARLVRFVCAGEPSWLPPEVEQAAGSRGAQRFQLEGVRRERRASVTMAKKVEEIQDILGIKQERSGWSSGQVWFEATRPSRCGWYPKNAPTHGVTLLGGPGVGKSTVMTTGLPTFVRSAFGLGLRIRFEDAEDNLMYGAYDDLYWRGILPSPTELGVRHSIEFYAEETADPASRTHFVFTDIPGEIVAGGIQDPGTHPIIYNSLRHARTVVFFLDLTLERDVRESIVKNRDAAQYPRLQESADDTLADRKGDPAEQARPSTADVSQRGLLYQLIEDLREIHGEDGLRGINFIVVIPKADLYALPDGVAAEPGTPRPFLQPFFDEMRNLEVLRPSPYLDRDPGRDAAGSPLAELRSSGAVPGAGSLAAGDPAQVRAAFAERLRTISDAARKALAQVTATSSAGSDPETEMLGDFLHAGIIQTLEGIFTPERVHFLPVSAAGAGKLDRLPATGDGRKPGRLAEIQPPGQMLSELVFAAPISIALTGGREQPQAG